VTGKKSYNSRLLFFFFSFLFKWEGVNEDAMKDHILTDRDELLQLVNTKEQKKYVGHH